MSQLRPGLEELALAAGKVLVYGNGGGGDVVQGLPVANHLERLGVEVLLGGVSGAWMTDDGHVPTDPATVLLGAEIFDVAELQDATVLYPNIAEVSATTTLRGRVTAEAATVKLFNRRAIVVGLGNGVTAARRDLAAFVRDEGIGLVVAVDVGSDTLFSGREANPAKTAFVDFLSLGTLVGLPCPRIFGLGGFGCDGELLLEDLERNVATVMQAGGYLGAIGVTQQDVVHMDQAVEIFADPVGVLVPRAAQGEFGWVQVATNGPWGTPVRVTPLAAVTLFLDPDVIVGALCPIVAKLAEAATQQEAEEIFENLLGVVPETRLLVEAALRRQAPVV